MGIEEEILVLLNGLPINQISQEIKSQINTLSKDIINLNEILITLDNTARNDNETRKRVYFTVLISRISILPQSELEFVLEWATSHLNLPEQKWIWYLDEYQMSKPSYLEQIAFKEQISGILTLLKEIFNNDKEIVQSKELAIQLSWYFMDELPWTNQTIHNQASQLLNELDVNFKELTESIHQDFKDLSKSEKLTNAGYSKSSRLNSGLRPKLSNYSIHDPREQWKELKIRSVSTISYILSKFTSKDIKNNWWLISPSILNILDDHEGPIKLVGVRLLSELLDVVDEKYLQLTKLGTVYRDSLTPLLTYLPKLTPTKLSCLILNETYPTLIKLFLKMSESEQLYKKQLLELLNSGIFTTMNSVRDNFEILIILLTQTTNIVNELKLQTLMALPRLMYHLGSIITDPFIDISQKLFETTLRCLVTIEINSWPRLYEHRYDFLGMISFALKKEEKNDEVIKLITQATEILNKVIKSTKTKELYEQFIADVEELCQTDEALVELLQPTPL